MNCVSETQCMHAFDDVRMGDDARMHMGMILFSLFDPTEPGPQGHKILCRVHHQGLPGADGRSVKAELRKVRTPGRAAGDHDGETLS